MANFNLDVTLKKSLEEFKSKRAEDMAWKTGTEYRDGKFSLTFLNLPVEVTYPEGVVVNKITGEEIGLIERILILHYFTHSGGSPILNKNITFKELPGGNIYIDPFSNRCIRPLIHVFGKDLDRFRSAGEKFGGEKQAFGDISFRFYPLPRIPVTFVLWGEDEEFPPNANIILDESASDYLPTEDYAFLCGMLFGKLKGCLSK
ncbi:DUF3786 domain-containing protein [Candidatus Formimonas warabiya]|uniref:DUF3786 domain-containing protein n=1 Tax=Formimonas warabiya TaxID=1761012 RepID=A0A3G1KPG4_FORW1|nr:DUF3786 domain-containing protein [Candidatus Formimonas warabiya]ATW24359.1 hypothetical protein DCMF_05775 [Candidatus Formimonas warabiya]